MKETHCGLKKGTGQGDEVSNKYINKSAFMYNYRYLNKVISLLLGLTF